MVSLPEVEVLELLPVEPLGDRVVLSDGLLEPLPIELFGDVVELSMPVEPLGDSVELELLEPFGDIIVLEDSDVLLDDAESARL